MAGKNMRRKFHKLYRTVKPVFVVLILIVAAICGSSFAKYYSMQKQKGVAVASDFYFSSDILRTGITLGAEGEVPENLSPYVATNVWNSNGTLSTVTFVIRNYANFLLYNDENIEIQYDLYAVLSEEDTSGIEYYFMYEDNKEIKLSTIPVKIQSGDGESLSLKGGEPLTNTYAVQYRYPAGTTSVPKNVNVWVVPTAPSYIPKEEYSMGCSISVGANAAEFTFNDGWGFVTLDDDSAALNEQQISAINAQAGFVYNVSTTGSNTAGTNAELVNVSLKWNSKYVELDRFSSFYDASKIVTDANGMKTLEIAISTYTSNDILFYRTSSFKTSDFTTQGEFNALVDAVDISATKTATTEVSETE